MEVTELLEKLGMSAGTVALILWWLDRRVRHLETKFSEMETRIAVWTAREIARVSKVISNPPPPHNSDDASRLYPPDPDREDTQQIALRYKQSRQ